MAGNYMNAPATRLAYDRDGSVGAFYSVAGLMTQLTSSQLRALNSETETGVSLTNQSTVAIVFPVPVNVAAVFFASTFASATWQLSTSTDTTTGLDGTWVIHQSLQNGFRDTKPNYRIATQLWSTLPGTASANVRGVRISCGSNIANAIKALHIYADISTAATVDRLAFWHPTLNEEVSADYFDWGNVPRGSSADRSFRIKNLSTVLTANNVTVYSEALTPGIPSVAGMHTVSSNSGSTFLSSVTITSVLPGAISGPVILRRVIPANSQVSVWSSRIAADVTNWTG